MTDNAVDMAWDGVRQKVGLKRLQFRDLRHLGGTHYAHRVPNADMLREILGHKTLHQAMVYVNLANQDVVAALDETEPDPATLPPLPVNIDKHYGVETGKAVECEVAEFEREGYF